MRSKLGSGKVVKMPRIISKIQYIITLRSIILYSKQYIYLEKLKDKNKCTSFNVDFLGYLSHLKHVLKIEENICSKNNEKLKFDKFNII